MIILIILFVPKEKTFSAWEAVYYFQGKDPDIFKMVSLDTNTYLLQTKKQFLLGDNEVKDNPLFYLTKDYGKTWDSIYSTIDPINKKYSINKFEGMQIISKDTIYIMISLEKRNAIFAKTYDGGKTWDSLYCSLARHDSASSLIPIFYFKNSKEGYYGLNDDSLLVTKDGGVSWKSMDLPKFHEDPDYNGYYISHFDFSKNTFLITVYRDYNEPKWKKLFVSNDRGKSWNVINDDSDTIAYGTMRFFCRSENEFWGIGNNPDNQRETVIRKTLDGGLTWERIDNGKVLGGFGLNIHFFGKDSIIVETLWLLLKSIDNGKTWEEYYEDNPQHNSLLAVTITGWNKGLLIHHNKVMQCNSNPISVKSEPGLQKLMLYPNPISANSTLNITYLGGFLSYDNKITIVDINGKEIDKFIPDKSSNEINLRYTPEQPFSTGTYFIIIESDGKVVAKEKFMVE
jgi:photosystem II stability/assembly factor-like uncharacterized protein